MVTKKIRGQLAGATVRGREREIGRVLFLARNIINWAYISFGPKRDTDGPSPPFMMASLNEATKRLPDGKAPGTNSIFKEVLKVAIKADPDNLLEIYNMCLRGGVFTEACTNLQGKRESDDGS